MADKNSKQPVTDPTSDNLEKQVDGYMDPIGRTESQADMPDKQPTIDIFKTAPGGAETEKAVFGDVKFSTEPPETDEPSDQESAASSDPLVDDIVAHESNELLAAEDAKIASAFSNDKPSFKDRIKSFFAAWWNNKRARYGSIAGVVILLVVAGLVPVSRYFVLNTVGARASASITVMDRTTQLPLKNVTVELGNVTAKSDQEGWVKLEKLKLGTQQLQVKRIGFADVTREVTIGLGSNPLGEEQLKAIGTQIKFKLVDFLSGKAIKGAEASSGDATAQSDSKGSITLTVGNIDSSKLSVKLSAKAYRDEKLDVDVTNKQVVEVVMVSSRKNVFVSKQSGKYDLFKVDFDGKNKKLLLAGSGLETNQLSLVQHATDNQAALVSTRDNKRNPDGYLLQTLTLLDVDKGTTLTLDHSEDIRIVDWVKDKLVYVKIKAGTSAGNVERYQLMAYDYDTAASYQLATANYFSDVVSAKGNIYYAASNNYQNGQSQFVKVSPDNTGKQSLLKGDVWNILRTSYSDLTLSTQQGWYSYAMGDNDVKKLAAAPANTNESRFYLDAPDGKSSLWTENRDGKGVLLTYDPVTKKDVVLVSQSGLTYPLKWLGDNTVVYRVVTSTETADYVISLDGGAAKKLSDVTNTAGFGRWFYYQ